jgi:hypothetical protein
VLNIPSQIDVVDYQISRRQLISIDNILSQSNHDIGNSEQDIFQSGDKIEYEGKKGRIIAVRRAPGQRYTITISLDEVMEDTIALPEDSPDETF